MSLITGDTIAERYVLGERLGSGGMAEVYRAEDQILHREVAVKILRDSTENDTDRARFAAEARTLAGLTHRHLVTVLDAGITTEQPYLVMELVRGETLSQRCARGRLPAAEVAAFGAQLADAVAFAHSRDVVHRDLKPDNVLITSAGQVKLADFGIARLIGNTVRHTQTGHAIGTAAYLAPEQVRGEDVGTEADVYTLGLVLLEALSGERAFPGPPTEAALARLSRPPEIPKDLDPIWQPLLTSMTHIDADRRPSAREVAAILAGPPEKEPAPAQTAVLTDLTPIPVHEPMPVPAPVTAGGRITRPWMILGLIAAAILVVVVLAVIATQGQQPQTPTPAVPGDVPRDLREPLQDLHDAVEDAQ